MRITRTVPALLAALVMVVTSTGAWAEIPGPLEDIVFGDEKRPVMEADVNGVRFEALATFSDLPYLLWPAEEAPLALFPRDAQGAAAWLGRAAEALGFAGFDVIFKENATWRSNEVWLFELRRRGIVLHDARIEVHRSGGRFVGIVNHTPGPFTRIDDPDVIPAQEEWVYHAVRDDGPGLRGAHRIEPARVLREVRENHERVTLVRRDGSIASRLVLPLQGGFQVIEPHLASFEEYVVPVGSFPDQISVADDGTVWLSQPNNNYVTEFNPATEQFVRHTTTGGSGPDGLIVGTQGRVWTGLYFGGGLGLWDSAAGTFSNYPAPYGGAAMAIPVETTDGHVWVTDHALNRISEFNPATNAWVRSLVMPTGNCWVVQGYEDRDHGQVYFTEYNANNLGRIAVGGNVVTDIPTLGGGPAFCVYDEGKVYYSRWNEAGIGVYDVASNSVTEYNFPVGGENGGPMWISPGGDVVTGTRNRGYIMVFHPRSESFSVYLIPTANPGLKDGLTVGRNGVIWFTESGANKVGKLILLPLFPQTIEEVDR